MLLQVQDLKLSFRHGKQSVPTLKGISFDIREGEILGVVGESGCGKSVTSLAIMGLLSKNTAHIDAGEIRFRGEDLLKKSEREMAGLRGNQISMIFQEPMTSLNPVKTIGRQVAEVFQVHQKLPARQCREKAVEMLRLVGIPSPQARYKNYPHQLSGGMRQRVMIAMALACRPALVIADEPTTALDVTIQAQILNLMERLKEKTGASILLITHDMGVVAEMCDRVVVMYAGNVVERAPVYELFAAPRHPYTVGLLNSIPRIDQDARRLNVIEGVVPSPSEHIEGCMFHPRCPYATDRCRDQAPPMRTLRGEHEAACWRIQEGEEGEHGS